MGICLGGFLGYVLTGVERHDPGTILGAFDSCSAAISGFIGAAIGGLLCAVGGAAVGAGLATSSRVEQAPAPRFLVRQGVEQSAPVPNESTETELARLKDRIAELEEQKRKEGAR